MAPRIRRRSSEGFSLVDLQPTLTTAVSTIADELSSQGVDVDTNSLLMGLQGLVNQLVLNNPGSLMASDEVAKPPYNLAADFIAIAYNHFHAGNKREAIQHFMTACEFDDAGNLVEAFLQMNNGSDVNARLVAADTDTPDTDATDDDADEEMSDEEIDDLINQSNTEDTADEDDDDANVDNIPMGGASSAKPVTASSPEDRAKRILAIKMSSTGDNLARKQAQRLLK